MRESGLTDGNGAAVLRVVSRNCSKNPRAIFGAASHRADFVHGGSNGHGPVAADAAVGGTQPADAAERRWANDGAPGLRADGKGGKPSGNNSSGAGKGGGQPASGS